MGRRQRATWVFATVIIAGCVPASVTSLVQPDRTKQSDTIRTGIKTSEEAPEESDLGPYGFRVQWIDWDSDFRNTDLRIGDRIIGVDDETYARSARKDTIPRAIGGWAEPQYWASRRARDGTRVTLHVWRRGKVSKVEGKLRAERFYYTADQKPALGPGGPERLARDEFSSAWAQWYEIHVRDSVRVLDGGWRSGSFNSRMLLAAHLQHEERVGYLTKHYPGPFADAVKADWDLVKETLLGGERKLTDEDLAYRTLGDKRAADIAEIAQEARRAFLARHEAETISAFPAIDPIEGDLDGVVGKIVVLPELGRRDWISEGGHGYLVAGDSRRGFYFVDSRAEAMKRVLYARFRYQEFVGPQIDETYAIIGRIEADPSIRVVGRAAVVGLSVEVLGATIGGKMFVDARIAKNGESPFAGQDTLTDLSVAPLAIDASPRQVMEASIAALKVGNQSAWAELFAPWNLVIYGPQRIFFNPIYHQRVPATDWVRGRRLILGEVYAINVVDVGLVHRLTTGKEFEGAPRVEQVDVEVEHIGKFPEGYRPFTNASVQRVWILQRVDGGPWRIVTRRGI